MKRLGLTGGYAVWTKPEALKITVQTVTVQVPVL
jgi:hypothetical protein